MARWVWVAMWMGWAGASLAAPVHIVITDLKHGKEVSTQDAELLGSLISQRIGAYSNTEVISGSEIRDLLAFQESQQRAGCDDVSCLSEIANSLGAEFIVTGQVGHLGKKWVLSIRLIDVDRVRVVGRSTARMDRFDEVPEELDRMVDDVIAPIQSRLGSRGPLSTLQWARRILSYTGYTLGIGGAATLALSHAILVITVAGLDSSKLDPAAVPLIGPMALFLDQNNSSQITDIGFACCSCQYFSCGAILCSPLFMGSSCGLGFFAEEDADEASVAFMGEPQAPPESVAMRF